MEWIDNIILGLIDEYGTSNIYELCDNLSVKIVKLDPDNIILHRKSAFYFRDHDNNEVIFIRNDLHEFAEQFIIKHELGHALCHPNILSAAYTFSNVGKLERQANYFALKLSNIDLDQVELEGMSLEQISNYIGIPYDVMVQLADL